MADVHHDDRLHPFRIEVVVLQEGQQREMPAVEHVKDGVGFPRGRLILRQTDEELVGQTDLRRRDCSVLGVFEFDLRGGRRATAAGQGAQRGKGKDQRRPAERSHGVKADRPRPEPQAGYLAPEFAGINLFRTK